MLFSTLGECYELLSARNVPELRFVSLPCRAMVLRFSSQGLFTQPGEGTVDCGQELGRSAFDLILLRC
ncbi:hypothetical protein N7G274_007906 [Stereocaulon virgatum]|uniref:Uncharacterized protein n=1 Tax=Stereocaulon virgatum TaxID=373712 RepID=A0ABR4A0V2_9LECA